MISFHYKTLYSPYILILCVSIAKCHILLACLTVTKDLNFAVRQLFIFCIQNTCFVLMWGGFTNWLKVLNVRLFLTFRVNNRAFVFLIWGFDAVRLTIHQLLILKSQNAITIPWNASGHLFCVCVTVQKLNNIHVNCHRRQNIDANLISDKARKNVWYLNLENSF